MAEPARSTPSSSIETELSMRRTGMSFQRTRLSADRTLMSVIRTSISLIGFGFTIYQVFKKLANSGVLSGAQSARRFGESFVMLGVGMLILGIIYHVMFMRGLRVERDRMHLGGMVHAESGFPVSLTLLVAMVLLLIGFVAGWSMVFHSGPFF